MTYPIPERIFGAHPSCPVYLSHHHFLAETKLRTLAYFSSFFFPREMAEGHHHGAIHEEEDSEDGKDFERFKKVFEMGRQI